MAARNYLAFDLGAESGRAVLGTLQDGKLALSEKHRFANPLGRLHGHWYWNLLAQWEQLKAGLRTAVAGGPRNFEISGIGVDTWGVDFGLISQGGEILGNPYHYRDSRTDGVMEKVFARIPRQRIFDVTGIQFMQFNTLYQIYAMRQANPKILAAAETLLFMPDLFNYLFTGVRKSESSIASTSQMLDVKSGAWATPMLEELDLPTRILAELIPSGSKVGNLSESVAAECGVGRIPVIAPGCHDTASAVAAVPAEAGNWCYISSGTWSLLGVEIDSPIVNTTSLAHAYTNERGVAGTFRLLRNIMGLWLVQECRRHWSSHGNEHTYDELTQMARRAERFSALVDPDHKPFAAPGDMPSKIEEFCRKTHQPAPSTPGEFVRTCLDSLALAYRRALEGLEDIIGHRIEVIHIVGGGCQNELLNQMAASACQRPVVAGPIEATAMGNLLVQAMAAGDITSLAQARQVVRASCSLKRYEPQDSAQWEQAYARYCEIIGR